LGLGRRAANATWISPWPRIVSDPVYEGKSMAALIDLVRDGTTPKVSNVLFG
jgi:1-aminocyclopropane-1-carboxylate deaminase/D-cysteine desulfhydrase-like pyridoxal-dependent ACC family enzyme